MKKRIALAAVAALAGGLLVAAPASAAVPATDVTFAVTVPANATAGAAATETATVVASTASVVNYVTWTNSDSVTVGGNVTVSGSTIISSTAGTIAAGSAKVTFETTTAPVIKFLVPTTPGTFTVTYTTAHDNGTSIVYATAQTLTVTVVAAAAAEAYNHTTVGAFSGFASSTGYVDASGNLFVPKALASPQVPETRTAFTITQYSNSDDTGVMTASLSKAVTVSLSGVGVISDGTSNNVTYLAYSAGSAVAKTIKVSSDGRSGVATITIAVDGVVAKTKTVTFYGAPAKYTATVNAAQHQALDSLTVTVKTFDAAGILVPGRGTQYSAISNDTATVALQPGDTPGVETYTVGSSVKYARTVTIGNGSAETATVVANFVTPGVKTVTLTADKASYAPGEKATFSVVAKNADGVVAGDASYTLTTTGSSASLYGAPATLSVVNGAATFTAWMPVSQGPVYVSAVVASSDAATLNLTVVDPAATAQAAAITALQTSVATLTTTVASLVASMTAQIKVINATMLKIQKQLAALAKKVK